MGYNDCKKHDWKVHVASEHTYAGFKPAMYICENCKLIMAASDVLQLKSLENQGESLSRQAASSAFLKKYYIFTMIVSITALVLSIISLAK